MPALPNEPRIPVDEEPLVTVDEIREAAGRLAGITLRTPLLAFGEPIAGDPRGRTRVWLKAENLQPIGAFKLRGAYNALAQLTADQLARGVVTHSSGNHAQGVARAARLLGTSATVVMPRDASAIKVDRVRADGADIIFVGSDSDERQTRAQAISDQRGLALIPSYDDRRIISGQGTAGMEIVEDLTVLQDPPGEHLPAGPFTVLVPIGGGGLISGVATAVKALRPDAAVIGVEPELAADARQSLVEDRIVRWEASQVNRTSADGMRTMALSRLTFRHIRRLVDGIVTVSEPEIAGAMVSAARAARLIVEPSGATSLAAWLYHQAELPAEVPVVCLISGGNVDAEVYARMTTGGALSAG